MNEAHFKELHRAYVNLTGLDVAFKMTQRLSWEEWLSYRDDDPFTAADLGLVIDHLRRGIRDGQRNPGALRFRNLIEDAKAFDEERAAARKARDTARKPRPPATVVETTHTPGGGTVNRIVPNTNTQDTSRPVADVSQKALGDLRKLKESLAPSAPSAKSVVKTP